MLQLLFCINSTINIPELVFDQYGSNFSLWYKSKIKTSCLHHLSSYVIIKKIYTGFHCRRVTLIPIPLGHRRNGEAAFFIVYIR